MQIVTVSYYLEGQYSAQRDTYIPIIRSITPGIARSVLSTHISLSNTIRRQYVTTGTLGVRKVNRTHRSSRTFARFIPERFCKFEEYLHLSPDSSAADTTSVLLYLHRLNFKGDEVNYGTNFSAVSGSKSLLSGNRYTQKIRHRKPYKGSPLLYFTAIDNVVHLNFLRQHKFYFGWNGDNFVMRPFQPKIDYSQLQGLEEYLLAEQTPEIQELHTRNAQDQLEIRDARLLLQEQEDFTAL